MYPVLLKLSESIKIYSFGTFIVLAFLLSAWYVRRRSIRDLSLDGERVFNVCFALLFIGLAGARLLFVLIDYERFSQSPLALLEIWKGGLVWYGGLLLALVFLAWWLPRNREFQGFAFTDRLSLGAGLAIFVGRWASFLSGENYGKPAPDLPWAVTFPIDMAETQAPRGVALHPTQLYHSLHGLLLFVLLLLFMKRKPAPGRTTGLFLMLYALGRGVIEIWRGDEIRGMVIDEVLSISQVISIPVFFIGLAIFLICKGRPQPEAVPSGPEATGT